MRSFAPWSLVAATLTLCVAEPIAKPEAVPQQISNNAPFSGAVYIVNPDGQQVVAQDANFCPSSASVSCSNVNQPSWYVGLLRDDRIPANQHQVLSIRLHMRRSWQLERTDRLLPKRKPMRRRSKRRTSHDRDRIPPAANGCRVRSTTSSNDRIPQPGPGTRRLLRYNHNGRARSTESGARRMRHNIDRCGSTGSESARCRCWRGCAVPASSARQDVQWRVMRDDRYCNDLMNYEFTQYDIVRGARLLDT